MESKGEYFLIANIANHYFSSVGVNLQMLNTLSLDILVGVFAYCDFFETLPCTLRLYNRHIFAVTASEMFWRNMCQNSFLHGKAELTTWREAFIQHFTSGCYLRYAAYEEMYFAKLHFGIVQQKTRHLEVLDGIMNSVHKTEPKLVQEMERRIQLGLALRKRFCHYLQTCCPDLFYNAAFAEPEKSSFILYYPLYNVFGGEAAIKVLNMRSVFYSDINLLIPVAQKRCSNVNLVYNIFKLDDTLLLGTLFPLLRNVFAGLLLLCRRVHHIKHTTVEENSPFSSLNPLKNPSITYNHASRTVIIQSMTTPNLISSEPKTQMHCVTNTELIAFWKHILASEMPADKVFCPNSVYSILENML